MNTISTLAELDDLPAGSLLIGAGSRPAVRSSSGEWAAWDSDGLWSCVEKESLAALLPAVLQDRPR